MDANTLLSEAEAAKRLAVKPVTLLKWRYRRRGPAYIKTQGKLIRYRLADIDAFIETCRIDPTQRPIKPRRV